MCGIVGIFGHREASTLAYLALYALQHRGQESAGIVTSDGDDLTRHAGMGHVADVFSRDVLERLPGTAAIGHVRYSTAGDSTELNAQPFLFRHHRGPIALSHNGNLVNASLVRADLEADGSIFQTNTDTETILHLAARARVPDVVDALVEALRQLRGAYSLTALVPGRLIAARDPMGFRPLSVGRIDGAWVVASESCAFDLLGAKVVREVERGEVLVADVGGLHSFRPFEPERPAPCFFEQVYFSRPDSLVFGDSVAAVRKRLGEQLWRECPADVDVVVPVPDSGTSSALGYAQAAGLPFEMGLVRNHYVGRTFIEPSQQIRDFGVRLKLNPVRDLLVDRRVALIDDSIVRGTTSRKIVRLCRDAGARGPRAHRLPADDRSLPLRNRHAAAPGADRGGAHGRGDEGVHRGGQPGLPRPGGDASGRRAYPGRGLHGLLVREQPVRLPVADSRQMGLFEVDAREVISRSGEDGAPAPPEEDREWSEKRGRV